MVAKKYGKRVYNRLTVAQLHAEVETLRKRNDELESEARRDREDRVKWAESVQTEKETLKTEVANLVSAVETLRTLLEAASREASLREEDYRKLADDSLRVERQLTKENIKLAGELEKLQSGFAELHGLADVSHETVLRYSDLLLRLLAGEVTLQPTL